MNADEAVDRAVYQCFCEAMELERAEVLGAMPYRRTESRRGYANSFKPKTVSSRLGQLRL